MSCIVVEAEKLSKTFAGGVVAVTGLDLRIPAGSIYGLIGRNGAGKTTTLRLLLGLLRADSGSARILGHDLWAAPGEVRQRIAYVPQVLQLPGWMTVAELCRYLSHFYLRWDADLARAFSKRWNLPRDRAIATLSGGEQRLAAILVALAAQPEVLLLDEPAAGLDPIARRGLLRELIDALAHERRGTVLFSTHYVGDLERVAEYVGIMHRGRMTTSIQLDQLLLSTKRVQVVFDQTGPPPGFAIPGALRVQNRGPVVTAIVKLVNDQQLDPVRQLRGTRVNVFEMGLEELFIELFSHEPEEEYVLGI